MALFKKKTKPEAPMDLEAVMKKFDQESNVRIWEGKPRIAVNCVLAAFSLFCLYVTLFASWLEAALIVDRCRRKKGSHLSKKAWPTCRTSAATNMNYTM